MTSSFDRRLNLARGVMGLGVVLLAVLHVVPMERGEPRMADEWVDAGRKIAAALDGRFHDLGEALVLPGLVLVAVALPFLAGLLARARPLRSVLNVLVGGVSGWLVMAIGGRPASLRSVGPPLLLGGVALIVLGLLLIPQAIAEEGPEGAPRGWKRPLVCTLAVLLVFASPWLMVPFQKGRWIRECRETLVIVKKTFVDFKAVCGRLPTTEEGWGPLIEKPAWVPAGVPWSAHWAQPAEDPWGHALRYTMDPVDGRATLTSDGPDGLPGTADDISESFGP